MMLNFTRMAVDIVFSETDENRFMEKIEKINDYYDTILVHLQNQLLDVPENLYTGIETSRPFALFVKSGLMAGM